MDMNEDTKIEGDTVQKERILYKNQNLPTIFSDGFLTAGRKDGLVLIEFYTNLPGRKIENFRTMITNETAIKLAEALGKAKDEAKPKKGVIKSKK